MATAGLTIGGGSNGVTVGGVWYPTESGLSQSGGILDRLQAAVDNRANYQSTMRGLAPALQASGVPVDAPSPSVFSQLFSTLGIGGAQQPQPQAMPLARATPGSGASMPTGPGDAQTQAQPMSAGQGSPAVANGFMPKFGDAIAGIESGGRYDATGPDTGGGNRALGKYQVMASNVGPWTKEVLGQEMSPEQFLASPQAQDAVFNGKFGQYLRQTGNPQDAASMWFTGRPLAQGGGARDQLGTTGSGYVGKFMARLRGGGAPGQDAGGLPSQAMTYAPAGSDAGPMMPQATASRAQPTQAVALANTNVLGAPGGGGPGAVQGGAPASPSQVIAPLMANAATRPIAGALWQHAQQNGAMGGQLSLPGGMSPEALAAMISEPATQKMGLELWQKALFPAISSVEPGRAIFRGTQYIGQAPSAPMAAPLDTRIVDPNSGRIILDGSPKLEHGEIGRDAYGQPVQGSINPLTGTATPFQSSQPAMSGAATGPDGQPLSGDAFLSTLPPAMASQVKAAAEGRMKLPSGMSASNPMAQRIRTAVLQYDPSFDQTGVDARFETRGDFAKGDAAKAITAGNTALIHLGEVASLIDKLGNADTSIPGNNLYNYAKNSANASSAAGAPLAAFNNTVGKYVEEATKFYRGTGGTEADIHRDLLNISPDMSPTQLKAAIAAQIPLLQGKVDALQSRWKQGMGPQAGNYPIMSPQAQAVIDRLSSPAGSPSGPAAAGLPIATPAGGSAPPAPSGGAQQGGSPSAGAIPTLTDPAQLQALPPGSRFRTPDGQLRVKH